MAAVVEGASLYRSSGLDRADERRTDAVWLRERLERDALAVPVWRSLNLVGSGEAEGRAVYPPLASVDGRAAPIFLGVRTNGADAGHALFAVAIDAADETTALADAGAGADHAHFADLWSIGGSLAPEDESILGYARAMTYWQRGHRHCGRCGALAVLDAGGHVLRCSAEGCGGASFPRTDPATIMLVHRAGGDLALLGRKAEWPEGRYSTLAGFVEPGESLEDAVAREVREEAGVEVGPIRYFASQPWPYPQSIMLGFFAEATTAEIRIGDELEDAKWFTRDEVRAMIAKRSGALPGIDTIARRLIHAWLAW